MKQNVSNGYASGIRDLEIIRDGKINLNNIGNYIDRFNEQGKDLYDKFSKEQKELNNILLIHKIKRDKILIMNYLLLKVNLIHIRY